LCFASVNGKIYTPNEKHPYLSQYLSKISYFYISPNPTNPPSFKISFLSDDAIPIKIGLFSINGELQKTVFGGITKVGYNDIIVSNLDHALRGEYLLRCRYREKSISQILYIK